MLITTILVAALLLLVSLLVLADACRPMLLLNLENNKEASETHKNAPAINEKASGLNTHDEGPHVVAEAVPLSDEDREGFFQVWHSVREGFETDPASTVLHADLLMSDLIQDCHYQMLAGDRRTETLSRFHYRSAHEIAMRSKEGCAKPGDLKRAINLYSALFDELLGMPECLGAWARGRNANDGEP